MRPVLLLLGRLLNGGRPAYRDVPLVGPSCNPFVAAGTIIPYTCTCCTRQFHSQASCILT